MGAVDNRELLSVCRGEAVCAVLICAHGPDVRRRVAGQLVICREGQLCTHQILPVVGVKDRVGQRHAVRGVVDDNLIAGCDGIGKAACAGGKELEQEGRSIIRGKGIGSVIILIALQIERFAVFGAVHALDIEAALDRFQLPKAEIRSSRRKGEDVGGGFIGSQELAGSIPEDIVAVCVYGNGQFCHIFGDGQPVVFHHSVGGGELGAADRIRQNLCTLGIVNVDLVAVCNLREQLSLHPLRGLRIGIRSRIGVRIGIGIGVGRSVRIKYPEFQSLVRNITRSIGLVASPVGCAAGVDTQITGRVVRLLIGDLGRKIALFDQRPDCAGLADADTVVGILRIQVARVAFEQPAALRSDDVPAEGAAVTAERQNIVFRSAGHRKGLSAGTIACGRQGICSSVFGHGDRHGVTCLDIGECDLGPCAGRRIIFGKGNRGQHRAYHSKHQQPYEDPMDRGFHSSPPS